MPPKKNNQLGLKNRLLTAAATIASSSFLLLGSLLLMVLVGSNLAYAQLPDNRDDELTQTAVPEFDFNNANKSMVVLLKFTALNKAEFVGVGVSYGPPHSNIGNPPLLRVQIYDYNGTIIQQFNYWHPLFALEFQEDGKEYLKILPNAVGRFVFPFDPNAALMKVSYLHHDGANNTWAEEVISVDLRSTISDFCYQFPDDPDCRSSDLAIVDVSTADGRQQLPILLGDSADVTVQTTVTNTGPDAPIDAALSSRAVTPRGSDGVLVTPAAGARPHENGRGTTIGTSLNERQQQQHDQIYTIECWEPGKHNIAFESEITSQSGAVADTNKANNKRQINLEVDCDVIDDPPSSEPLGVSIESNVTEDGSPPTTVEFNAIANGGIEPHKFGWNFDDDGDDDDDNNIKGDQSMIHQFTRLGQYNVTVAITDSANGHRGQTASDNIIITINDKEPPQISVPSQIIAEATRPDGANVTFRVSAIDIVDRSVPVRCDRDSGSIFHLGTTTVKCETTDKSGNTGYGNFNVIVQDTIPPTIIVPPPITTEASGPSTSLSYPTPTAKDTVDPSTPVTCFPASPITIAGVGSQAIRCEATDSHGNIANATFVVSVQDSTAPEITVIYEEDGEIPKKVENGKTITLNTTGSTGTNVTLRVSATDIVDGSVNVGCQTQSGNTFQSGRTNVNFQSGTTPVSCIATDKSGNSGYHNFTVNVQQPDGIVGLVVQPDITSPDIKAIIDGIQGSESNGWYISDVAVSWTVTDGESQINSTTGCDPTTITEDTIGTEITCEATSEGGPSSTTIVIKRDATAPNLSIDSGISDGEVFEEGQVASEPICIATDDVSGIDE